MQGYTWLIFGSQKTYHFTLLKGLSIEHCNTVMQCTFGNVCLLDLDPFRSSTALQGESDRDKEEEEFKPQ